MFNSGAADNGYYTSSIRKNTAEEAIELADKIEKHAIHHRFHHASHHDRPLEKTYDPSGYTEDNEDESRLLIEDLIPNDGYFISAKAYETLVQRTPLNLSPD
jgi:CRISPR/Cas system CSM-associated protein Csm3 (group 7 of RAMP superfamily)